MLLEHLYHLFRADHLRVQGIIDTLTQPLVLLDQNFLVVNANNAFIQTFGVDRDEVLGSSLFDLGGGQWDIEALSKLIADVIPRNVAVVGYEVTRDFPGIGQKTFVLEARRMVHADNNAILVGFEDVTARRLADSQKDIIISEGRHRLRNLSAVVRSIALQTEIANRTASEYRDVLLGRLDAALKAQEISAELEKADFAILVEGAVNFIEPTRILISAGPCLQVPRSKVIPVAMIFHELTTNAMKHGALSGPDGLVQIGWNVEARNDGRNLLTCIWREENGRSVKPPSRRGSGTALLERIAKSLRGSAELKYDVGGLAAIIKLEI
jgi:PAS domain S-box-containing protein